MRLHWKENGNMRENQTNMQNKYNSLIRENENLRENQTNVQTRNDELLKNLKKRIEILKIQNEKMQESVQTENYELIVANTQLKNKNKIFIENIEKLRQKSIRKETNSDAKIKNLEYHIEKLEETQSNLQEEIEKVNVENKKFLGSVQMIGKIFNEVSDFNIETKNLIEKVTTALGKYLPEPFDVAISFSSEIKKEIKNEIKIEVDDSKFDQDPDQHTIYFDFD